LTSIHPILTNPCLFLTSRVNYFLHEGKICLLLFFSSYGKIGRNGIIYILR